MNKIRQYISAFAIITGLFFGFNFNLSTSYAALPVCSDLVDNDADGLIDSADPQCHIDGDASNPGSWDEFGTSERSFVPPIVNAGPDVSIVADLGSSTSAATASDADGTIVLYEWTNISGPAGASISSSSTLQTDFSNLAPGIYEFKLKVTDNDGLTAEDTVQITVTPPVVNIGGGGGGGGGGILIYVCSDSLDNDTDGLIDRLDPGCHTDGDVNNLSSYNFFGSSEFNAPPVIIPTPTPVVTTPVVTPVPQVLGASTVGTGGGDECIPLTGRPCVLQKTGGKISLRNLLNQKANKIAKAENNQLIIPKLGINKPILRDQKFSVLRNEAMILPWTSTPDKGGNTVVVGHAYNSLGGRYSKSTFFELDTMKVGDEITMNWKGKKYTYVVSETKKVKPTDISLEDQTASPRLTIYSCGRFTNKTRTAVIAVLKADTLEETSKVAYR